MVMKRNVCLKDFEEEAFKLIEKAPLDYYRSGAGEEYTLNLNQEAFKRFDIFHIKFQSNKILIK